MPKVFFVTQGQAYWFESRDGYIWAPKPLGSLPDRFFWRNVELVRAGDLIIHYAGVSNGGIRAISQAMTNYFDSPITPDLRTIAEAGLHGIANWNPQGRRVDCRYVNLESTMPIKLFTSVILSNKCTKYSAFDKNGDVCQGYLYELEHLIARNMIRNAIDLNPYLRECKFIIDMLNDLERN